MLQPCMKKPVSAPKKPEIKEANAASGGEAQPEGIFPQQVMHQLEAVFERMQGVPDTGVLP